MKIYEIQETSWEILGNPRMRGAALLAAAPQGRSARLRAPVSSELPWKQGHSGQHWKSQEVLGSPSFLLES